MLNPTVTSDCGNVFNIQRYNMHDGSGIRTIVFLKGCALRCKWCANPEGISGRTQMRFFADRCIHCGACAARCKNGAIVLRNGEPVLNREVCVCCGACTDACFAGAREIVGHSMSAEAVMQEVRRDFQFFRRSGGGLTLSGGEALLQRDFVRTVLEMAREEGINTAIETCGYVPWTSFESVLPYVNLFLFDLKHMDAEKHLRLTGQRNDLILSNARRLAAQGAQIIFRVPVIPGLNDSEANIRATARFAAELGVGRVELLPYHQYGVNKYAQLGLVYELPQLREPESEHMCFLRSIVEEELSRNVENAGC